MPRSVATHYACGHTISTVLDHLPDGPTYQQRSSEACLACRCFDAKLVATEPLVASGALGASAPVGSLGASAPVGSLGASAPVGSHPLTDEEPEPATTP